MNLNLQHSVLSHPPTLLRSRTSDSMLSDPSLLQLSNISGDKTYITYIVILSVVDSFVRHPCISWIEEYRIECLTLSWYGKLKTINRFKSAIRSDLINQMKNGSIVEKYYIARHFCKGFDDFKEIRTKIVKLNTTKLAAFIHKFQII